ncbi:MAG: hypothetical protein R3D25_04455 [Geminicoccaceae bacterium]
MTMPVSPATRLAQRLAVVRLEIARDPHVARLAVAAELPFARHPVVGVAQAVVAAEILGHHRRPVTGEIGVAGGADISRGRELLRDQVAVVELTDADRQIEALVDQVDPPVVEHQIDLDLGMRRHEAGRAGRRAGCRSSSAH